MAPQRIEAVKWVKDEQSLLVAATLAKCSQRKRKKALVPDASQVVELARWIKKYMATPWEIEGLEEYRAKEKAASLEREKLSDAAEILKRRLDICCEDPSAPPPFLTTHSYRRECIRNLKIAISELERDYSLFDNWLPETPSTGKGPPPWAVVARKLGIETRAAIQAAQIAAGKKRRKTFGGEDDAIVCFVSETLRQIYPNLEPFPSNATILDAMKLADRPKRTL